MANMSRRVVIMQAHQIANDEIRAEFEAMGEDGRYNRRQKNHALKLIDEYGVRATARILHIPRRTLQRWCRGQGKCLQRCPHWVYSWATKRQKWRESWVGPGGFLTP